MTIPEWMINNEHYEPPREGGSFACKTLKSLGKVMGNLRIQKGHEKGRSIPALVKLLAMVALILVISLCHQRLVIMTIAAVVLLYLCTWPAEDIWSILKTALFGATIAAILFVPAGIMRPAGINNYLAVVAKVFLSVTIVGIFNHTTQWNHITGAFRKLHIPGVMIFTLDITVKYIILLGNLMESLLTALHLRSVGKNNRKYQSVGGVMGVTFLRSTEMCREMYEAMRCRGFTDDYGRSCERVNEEEFRNDLRNNFRTDFKDGF